MYKKTTLKNKLRIITNPNKGTEAVTLLILVGAGSRYESKKINGASHFMEHMFFKGGKTFPDTKAVAEALDEIGSSFNAFTGKEYTGYYVKVAKEHLEVAYKVLSDMLNFSAFDKTELEKERLVILEEINMYEDNPMAKVDINFEQLMYGDQPLGWDIAGPKEVIQNISRTNLIKYKEKLYKPDNLVISVAGNVSEKRVKELTNKYFGEIKGTKSLNFKPCKPINKERLHIQKKKTEQANLIFGVPAYKLSDKRQLPTKLLSIILGGNMSSRMFLSVREKQGLCYYVYTQLTPYLDSGYLATAAGVDLKRVNQAIKAIKEEYNLICEQGVLDKELRKAKEFLKGKLTLSLEDSENMASFLGKQELLQGKVEDFEVLKNKIEKITEKDILVVARDLLKEEKMKLAVIGPFGKKDIDF